jgi:hypothetical protein
MRRLPVLVGLAAGLAVVGVVARRGGAEEDTGRPYAIDTTLGAGYRMVDIDGSKDKYKEDYNLRSGFRLFDLDIAGASRKPDETRLDRFHLEVDTPGDEPVSHFRLSAADRKLYDFRADFTRSKYFYQVPQLFEQAVAGDVRVDDLHDFDTIRTNGTVDLTVRAPNLPTLFFGYRLYERHGGGTSTVLVPGGDDFVVNAPLDTATHVGRVGTEFDVLGTDVFLQQEYRRVNRFFDWGPVRTPLGLDPSDGSDLTLYRSNQTQHLDIPATTVRVLRPIGDVAELRGAYYYGHAILRFDESRARTATTLAPGLSGSDAAVGGGSGTLDTHVADLGASVRLTDRARLHVDYRYNERTQDGSFDERSTLGVLAATAGDSLRVNSVTGDVEYEPRPNLNLRGGLRYAWREARFSQSEQDISTGTLGAVGGIRYRPWSFLDLFARYENVQVNDPFVVPGDPANAPPLPEREIALTFTNRGRAGFQVVPRDWMTLRYEFIADSRENASFAARSQVFGNSVSVAVTPLPDLTLFAGYTRRDLGSEADVLIAPLYGRSLSLQNGTEDVFVSQLRYEFGTLGQKWSTGFDVAYVNAQNTLRPKLEPGLSGRKFFDLDRVDGGAYLAWHHRLIEPSVEFRMIDYNERVLPRNDYRATILVFKLTKRWSF